MRFIRFFFCSLVSLTMLCLYASSNKSKLPIAVEFTPVRSFDHVRDSNHVLVHYCYRPEHIFVGNEELYLTLYKRYIQAFRTDVSRKQQAFKYWQEESLKSAWIASNNASRRRSRETEAPCFNYVLVDRRNKRFGFDPDSLPNGFSMVQCLSHACDASFRQTTPHGSLFLSPSHVAHCVFRFEIIYEKCMDDLSIISLFATSFSEVLRQLSHRRRPKEPDKSDDEFILVSQNGCHGVLDTIAIPLLEVSDSFWKRRSAKSGYSLKCLQIMGYAQGLKQFLTSKKPLSVKKIIFLVRCDNLDNKVKETLNHLFEQVLSKSPEALLLQLDRKERSARLACSK